MFRGKLGCPAVTALNGSPAKSFFPLYYTSKKLQTYIISLRGPQTCVQKNYRGTSQSLQNHAHSWFQKMPRPRHNDENKWNVLFPYACKKKDLSLGCNTHLEGKSEWERCWMWGGGAGGEAKECRYKQSHNMYIQIYKHMHIYICLMLYDIYIYNMYWTM